MRVRTVLIIVGTIALALGIVSIVLANTQLLEQQLTLWGGGTISVATALLGAFVAGLLVASIIGFSREAGVMLERWRMRRATRTSEEVDEEYARGLVAVLEGRDDEALTHFRAVMERDSRHLNTLLKIGEVLRARGRHDEAIEYHRKAHHIRESDTRPLYALVEDHEAAGDPERALAVLGKIIAINKQSAAAWRKLRWLHSTQGRWDRALEAHERVEKLARSNDASAGDTTADRAIGLGLRYEMAKAALAAGRSKEAVAGLRRVLKLDGGFIPAHVLLGDALAQAGQGRDAVGAWESGFDATGSPIFLARLEQHHLEQEQPLAAIEALKGCIGRAEKDTVPRFYLGKLYFRLEMLDDALAVLTSLEGRASYAPTLHYLIGRIHERRDQPRQAVAAYRKGIREMELVHLDYECRACGETHVDWTDRCDACEAWNTIEINFREEIPLDELGIAPAPIYSDHA